MGAAFSPVAPTSALAYAGQGLFAAFAGNAIGRGMEYALYKERHSLEGAYDVAQDLAKDTIAYDQWTAAADAFTQEGGSILCGMSEGGTAALIVGSTIIPGPKGISKTLQGTKTTEKVTSAVVKKGADLNRVVKAGGMEQSAVARTSASPASAKKVTAESRLAESLSRNKEARFADEQKLMDHFNKHGREFGARTPEEYLQIAQDIIRSGQRVEYFYKPAKEIRVGYVQFMGNTSKGNAKFGFVGTNPEGVVTTLHTESGKSFWKMLNNDPLEKIIRKK